MTKTTKPLEAGAYGLGLYWGYAKVGKKIHLFQFPKDVRLTNKSYCNRVEIGNHVEEWTGLSINWAEVPSLEQTVLHAGWLGCCKNCIKSMGEHILNANRKRGGSL